MNAICYLSKTYFSQRTFDRIHALWVRTGNVGQHNFGALGGPHALQFDDVDCLLWLIHQRPDWLLDELQFLLQTNRFIAVHSPLHHHPPNTCTCRYFCEETQEDCIQAQQK